MARGAGSIAAAGRSPTRVCGDLDSGPSRISVPALIIADGVGVPSEISSTGAAPAQEWRDPHGALLACCYSHDGQHRIDLPGLANFFFRRDAEVVQAAPYPPARPTIIADTYHHSVLPVVLQALGSEVLHASAVLTDRGVVAFGAVSGAGKSTVAFGLGRRGYAIWADDALAMETTAPPRCVPLPFGIRLRPAAMSFFNNGSTAVPVAGRDGQRQPGQRPALAAICILGRATGLGDRVAVERLRPSAAFAAVLPHAYCFSLRDPDRKQQMMQHYLDLISRVPLFQIRFEAHLDRLPALLDVIELLARDL